MKQICRRLTFARTLVPVFNHAFKDFERFKDDLMRYGRLHHIFPPKALRLISPNVTWFHLGTSSNKFLGPASFFLLF